MTRTSALTDLVAAEDAAIYGYGIVAGQLRGAAARRARRILRDHTKLRDQWASALSEAGNPVPTPDVAYALPFAVYSPRAARSLAAVIDERLVGWYAELAAVGLPAERAEAVGLARTCATRAVTWGASPRAFPGDEVEPQTQDE